MDEHPLHKSHPPFPRPIPQIDDVWFFENMHRSMKLPPSPFDSFYCRYDNIHRGAEKG